MPLLSVYKLASAIKNWLDTRLKKTVILLTAIPTVDLPPALLIRRILTQNAHDSHFPDPLSVYPKSFGSRLLRIRPEPGQNRPVYISIVAPGFCLLLLFHFFRFVVRFTR
jgi:hypothetical protein